MRSLEAAEVHDDGGGADPRELLVEDHVVAEVVYAGAAILLVDIEPEEPELARRREEFAVHLSSGGPFLEPRCDLLLGEDPRHCSQIVVFRLKDFASHGRPLILGEPQTRKTDSAMHTGFSPPPRPMMVACMELQKVLDVSSACRSTPGSRYDTLVIRGLP